MIEAVGLTKRYGSTTAVDSLTFTVRPGVVTGFLGPNGAGKSTTMRMILGLDEPTSGTVTVAGSAYRDLPSPVRTVGALLDAREVDGVRSARSHLGWIAKAGGIPEHRVDAVLAQVGLTEVADKKVGGFSLGMSQRIGIAAALLGDPPVLLFDEPVNGLDAEGMRWVRHLMRGLASEGRTVLLSSHLMTEMEAIADRVLVIGRGRLIADATTEEFRQLGSGGHVRVVSPSAPALADVLARAGADVSFEPDGSMRVVGIDNVAIADLAAGADLRIHELTPHRATLEETFMQITHDAVEYRTEADGHLASVGQPPSAGPPPPPTCPAPQGPAWPPPAQGPPAGVQQSTAPGWYPPPPGQQPPRPMPPSDGTEVAR